MQTPKFNNSHAPLDIRTVIVESRPDVRQRLERIINGAEGHECAGSFTTMEMALAGIGKLMAARSPLDVALVDIGLPRASGIEGIRLLKGRHPQLLTLAMSGFDDDAWIFEALRAGATGYLLKNISPERLLESLREVVAGGAPMSPKVSRRVVEMFRNFHPPSQANYDLTMHEARILKMLVEGHKYKTAAIKLGVSINTVSFHVRRVYEKLEVHSKSEAVAKALRNNLV